MQTRCRRFVGTSFHLYGGRLGRFYPALSALTPEYAPDAVSPPTSPIARIAHPSAIDLAQPEQERHEHARDERPDLSEAIRWPGPLRSFHHARNDRGGGERPFGVGLDSRGRLA
jgi:hypothetical protein